MPHVDARKPFGLTIEDCAVHIVKWHRKCLNGYTRLTRRRFRVANVRHFRRRMSEVRIGDAAPALAAAGAPVARAEAGLA